MKINIETRRQMRNEILREALGLEYNRLNDEIQGFVHKVFRRKFSEHVEGYRDALTDEQIRLGFDGSVSLQMHYYPSEGQSRQPRVSVEPVAYRVEVGRRNDKTTIMGIHNPRYSTYQWGIRTLTTPHMRRNSSIELNEAETGEYQALEKKAEDLLARTRELDSEVFGALASCNSSKQVREMLPSAAKFLPPEPCKKIVPVESLSQADALIKKALKK